MVWESSFRIRVLPESVKKLLDNVIAFRLSGKEAEMLQSHIGTEESLAQCLPMLSAGELVL